ncbi:TylF/MycF/NovP-related O-methyltransferase [Phenylobacterium sp.]|uniref:TylF/MycF/NovP-related O-methyltransferase n=1 Tax=Phenylobacterium sp. TaxID=1871053 RepID=UPI002FCA2547
MGLIPLPEIGTPATLKGGRSARDGYQRGWGLMHAGVADLIAHHPLYQASLEAADGWSVMLDAKRMNLFLILTSFFEGLAGKDVIEFGSYRGGNALFMARVLNDVAPGAKVYALDTYEGMPATDAARDLHGKGDFGDSSYEALVARRDALGLKNLVVVKGLFQDTFPGIAKTRPSFGLAHIDCDIYSGVKYAQDAVWPFMTPGGYVAYDDADTPSCIGATEAVEELVMARRLHSEQVWPHWVFRAQPPTLGQRLLRLLG